MKTSTRKKRIIRKESKWLEIHVAIYRCSVVVTWEPSLKKIVTRAKRRGIVLSDKWQAEVKKSQKTHDGFVIQLGDDNPDFFVWLKERPKKLSQYGVLYHELYHAVDGISDDHGLETEKEARAYLYEYLVNACNQELWEKPS